MGDIRPPSPPRSVVIIGVCGKNNLVGNVFWRTFTALLGNLGATTLCQEAEGNPEKHEKETQFATSLLHW